MSTGESRDRPSRPRPGRLARTRGHTVNQRGEQTRQHIVETMIDLLGELQRLPTAKEIATRADVSLRLVFHHFTDMPTLYGAANGYVVKKYWLPMGGVSPNLALTRRINATVRSRGELFEQITMMRHSAIALAPLYSDLARAVDVTNALMRKWLEDTFEPELDAAGGQRADLAATIELVASWEAWDRLRRTQGLSTTAARRVMSRMLHAFLDPRPA